MVNSLRGLAFVPRSGICSLKRPSICHAFANSGHVHDGAAASATTATRNSRYKDTARHIRNTSCQLWAKQLKGSQSNWSRIQQRLRQRRPRSHARRATQRCCADWPSRKVWACFGMHAQQRLTVGGDAMVWPISFCNAFFMGCFILIIAITMATAANTIISSICCGINWSGKLCVGTGAHVATAATLQDDVNSIPFYPMIFLG